MVQTPGRGSPGSLPKLHAIDADAETGVVILATRRGAKKGTHVLVVDEALIEQVNAARQPSEPAPALPVRVRVESHLTPREIQSRLRGGRTVEQVAAEAGVDPSWVDRFAPPVLAEQTAAVHRAVRCVLHTPRRGPSERTLEESVLRNLAGRGVLLTEDEWQEAWRARHLIATEWLVTLTFRNRGRTMVAEWLLDMSSGALTSRNRLGNELGFVETARPTVAGALMAEVEADSASPRRRSIKQATSRRPSAEATARPAAGPNRAAATRQAAARKAEVAERARARRAAAAARAKAQKAARDERARAKKAAQAEKARIQRADAAIKARARKAAAADETRAQRVAAADKAQAEKATQAEKARARKVAAAAKKAAAKPAASAKKAAAKPAASAKKAAAKPADTTSAATGKRTAATLGGKAGARAAEKVAATPAGNVAAPRAAAATAAASTRSAAASTRSAAASTRSAAASTRSAAGPARREPSPAEKAHVPRGGDPGVTAAMPVETTVGRTTEHPSMPKPAPTPGVSPPAPRSSNMALVKPAVDRAGPPLPATAKGERPSRTGQASSAERPLRATTSRLIDRPDQAPSPGRPWTPVDRRPDSPGADPGRNAESGPRSAVNSPPVNSPVRPPLSPPSVSSPPGSAPPVNSPVSVPPVSVPPVSAPPVKAPLSPPPTNPAASTPAVEFDESLASRAAVPDGRRPQPYAPLERLLSDHQLADHRLADGHDSPRTVSINSSTAGSGRRQRPLRANRLSGAPNPAPGKED